MLPQTLEVIYENGALRLLTQPEGLAEDSKVKITIEAEEGSSPSLLQFAGILTDEEAVDLLRVIEEEFERIDPDSYTIEFIGNKNQDAYVIPSGALRNEESLESMLKSDTIGISRSFVARNDMG